MTTLKVEESCSNSFRSERFQLILCDLGSFRNDVIGLTGEEVNLFTTIPYLTTHLQQGETKGRMASSSSLMSRRHIPYLSFHKQIVREICRPQKDDLLLLAKGLGMRRVRSHCHIGRSKLTVQIVCALLKTYDRKEDLVLVVSWPQRETERS